MVLGGERGGVVGRGRSPKGTGRHWKKSDSMEVLGQGPGLVREGDEEEEWEDRGGGKIEGWGEEG